jgi:hypothetical protein
MGFLQRMCTVAEGPSKFGGCELVTQYPHTGANNKSPSLNRLRGLLASPATNSQLCPAGAQGVMMMHCTPVSWLRTWTSCLQLLFGACPTPFLPTNHI